MLKKIKGFPLYVADDETLDVWSYVSGRKRELVWYRKNRNSGSSIAMKDESGNYKSVSRNRLEYALRHDCSPDDIPHDLYIVREETGNLVLYTRTDNALRATRKNSERKATNRILILEEASKEIEILRRFYTSGDITEILTYIETIRDRIIQKFMHRYVLNWETAAMRVDYGVEHFIEQVNKPCSLFTCIGKNLYWYTITLYNADKKLSIEADMAEWAHIK